MAIRVLLGFWAKGEVIRSQAFFLRVIKLLPKKYMGLRFAYWRWLASGHPPAREAVARAEVHAHRGDLEQTRIWITKARLRLEEWPDKEGQ